MIELLQGIAQQSLPEWTRYGFMQNALLAVIFMTPVFALLGTMVVNKHMAFFSDVLGHSALTGIGIGVILGLGDPLWAMLAVAIVLSVGINFLKKTTQAASDTILGVLFAMMVAIGVVFLSRGGGFSKFTVYLIGDILMVSPQHIVILAVMALVVFIYWRIFGNNLVLISVNPSLARSRGIHVAAIELSFTILLAIVVTVSIRMVGILIINSLLILPAAASRNIAKNYHGYTLYAIIISLISGMIGLVSSYYWATSAGATIVIYAAFCYCVTAIIGGYRAKKKV